MEAVRKYSVVPVVATYQNWAVVGIFDHLNVDSLGHIFLVEKELQIRKSSALRCTLQYLLLPSEDVLIKEVLDLLVGNINAKLLEGIVATRTQMVLESENVQQANGQWLPTIQINIDVGIADEVSHCFP